MKKSCFLVLLFIPVFLFSQKKSTVEEKLRYLESMKEDTSKVNQLNKTALYFSNSDTAKAFFYNKKAIQLAKKLDWKEGMASSNYCLGTIYNAQFNYNKALYFFNQSLQTSIQKNRSKALQSIGEVYLLTSNFSKALEYSYQALKIDEAIGNKKGIAKIYANLGSINYGFQQYSKALNYYNKAAKLYGEFENNKELAIVNRNIAGVYNSLTQYDKALLYYDKAFILCKKAGDKSLQTRLLSDISLVHFYLKNYDKALDYCYMSLNSIPKGTQDKQTAAFSHGVLGDTYIEKAKSKNNNRVLLDSAIYNLNKAVKLHQELNNSRDLAYDFSSITQVYKLKGDFKKALESYEIAMVYEDSVFNFNNKETIKNLEDQRTIELRNREIKIKKLQLDAKEKQKWMLISGLVLLGVIGGLLFYQSSNRRKVNKKLQSLNLDLEKKNTELDEANKIKARFFSILNHDLRSPVYNLIHFLHLQKENPELLDEEMKSTIEKKTVSSAENLLTSMEDMLLWSKSQMENFKPQPKKILISTLFEDTAKHFAGEEKIKLTFENPDNIEITTDEDYLKTIIRNLTGNALKALDKTENPSIVWKAWKQNNITYLSVTDNGPGASQEKLKALYDDKEVVGIKTGLGLHLIRDLAKAIYCTITVDSKIDIGTTFTLTIP
ncbi:tetratricopeptide repeat-containing sensor histidine kinase [Flavobacterium sp. IMCC34852]|uniref:histidine kinase n=1 Tax=Flavobacterium rivulicola TaxID=2732161 RepID=A0A7Y3R6J4_9FLAO|nr:tetratricopeptide repeat protein [Flavobacterium sp. IMCC34852]NNT70736.1 tetratricopeptide repeat-containing sensor histidine kinase [Flavobacterium sp. IMCC34852]